MEAVGKLSRATALDLEAYRSRHVNERIKRAMETEGVEDEEQLARLFAHDAAARERFRRSLAVSVSGMFRDPEQFELLERELLPGLVERHGKRLRVWSVGAADGTELRSLSAVLARVGAREEAYLLGSDLLAGNVAAAHLAEEEPGLRFEQRDILRDGAPEGSWHLVLCRNVAIYLAPEARDRVHAMLAGALVAGGVLLLGKTERVMAPASLSLERIARNAYRRRG